MSLNLGICPHLTTLEIEAVNMTTLDLRGCGVLSQASIRCPHLSSLDASYCRQVHLRSASCNNLYVMLTSSVVVVDVSSSYADRNSIVIRIVQSTWRRLPGSYNLIMFCHSNFGSGCLPCSWACRVTGIEGASSSHNVGSFVHLPYGFITRFRGLSSSQGIYPDQLLILIFWKVVRTCSQSRVLDD